MLEDGYEESFVSNEEEATEALAMTDKDQEIAELRRRLAENDAILAELMFRQDSMEQNRQQDLEKRFEMVMRMVRSETGGERADVEEKAKKLYFLNNEKDALALQEGKREKADEVAQAKVAPKPTQPEEGPARTQEVARDRTLTEKPISTGIATTVKHRKFRDLQDVADGYYVVANVYKGAHYMNRFIDELQSRGIEASYVENPNNGLKYTRVTVIEKINL